MAKPIPTPAAADGTSAAFVAACMPLLRASDGEALLGALRAALAALGVVADGFAWHEQEVLRVEPAGLLDERAQAALAVRLRPAQDAPPPGLRLLQRDGAGLLQARPSPPGTAAAGLIELASQRLAELAQVQGLRIAVAELGHAERLQRALFAIADLAGSALDMDALLRGLHQIVGELMYAENFYIALYERERDSVRFVYFVDSIDAEPCRPDQEIPAAKLPNSITMGLIRTGQPLHGCSREVARALHCGAELPLGAPAVDLIGVPMRRGDEVVGALVVQSYVEGITYTATDQALLAFVAGHALNALDRRRGQEALERRVLERTQELAIANRQLQAQVAERERAAHLQATLYRIAALSSNPDNDEDAAFYRAIHQSVAELINAENFYIALLSPDRRHLHFVYAVDSAGECFDSRPVGHGVSEYTLRVGHSVLLDMAGIEALVRAGEVDAEAAGTPAVSWLGAPLLGPDGAMGLVAVQSYREQVVYDADDADLLTFVSHQIASSVERLLQAEALYKLNAELERRVQDRTAELRMQIAVREQVQEQLKHQVLHDPLTELPNRVHLRERLQRALARGPAGDTRRFALLYLDVDRFKLFNDSFGHAVGDAVLREVSRRLQACVREPDLVSRLSGDEFAILLEHCDEAATACRVAERIQSRLEAPIAAGERELRASVSIGIAISSPGCHGVDSVLHDADTALYRAKAAGRNRYAVHDPSLDGAGTNVLDLALQLRNALTLNQLQPHFQPIVRLDDGAVVGYEALVRWQHPVRGLLAPGAFLPVAQETGLIEAVDWHMYRIACAAALPLVAPGRYLTLNVSAPHFQREDFGQRLLALLAEIDFDPRCLRLEVTEGTLLADPQAVARILQGLLEAGVEAALDDFGTGYSSLGYVHRFPLRMIKIDRTFVTHLGQADAPRSTAIVGAVLSLTQALGMELVAEGVENEAQRQALIALGCRHAQGYLFGRPAPAACWLALDVPARPEVGAGGAG